MGSYNSASSYTFEGEVASHGSQTRIFIKIELAKNAISWEINGKIFKNPEYEYVRSKFSDAPSILCLRSQDGNDKHLFCGMFYDGGIQLLDRVIGIYKHIYPCEIKKKTVTCVEEFQIELSDKNSEYR